MCRSGTASPSRNAAPWLIIRYSWTRISGRQYGRCSFSACRQCSRTSSGRSRTYTSPAHKQMPSRGTQTDAIKGHIIWLNLLVADRRIRRKVGSRMSRKGSILASSGGSCSRSWLASLSDPSSSATDQQSPDSFVLAIDKPRS